MRYILLVTAAVIIAVCIGYTVYSHDKSMFSQEDNSYATEALHQLDSMIDSGNLPPEVSDEEFAMVADNVLFAKIPEDSNTNQSRENFSYFHPINSRYFPYMYYSFPYNYKYGGAWPPGLFSRLYFWTPGYYIGTGWSYYMRPGMGYSKWPRNRWIRNTQNGKDAYYYVSNRDDYIHDAANYEKAPLIFG